MFHSPDDKLQNRLHSAPSHKKRLKTTVSVLTSGSSSSSSMEASKWVWNRAVLVEKKHLHDSVSVCLPVSGTSSQLWAVCRGGSIHSRNGKKKRKRIVSLRESQLTRRNEEDQLRESQNESEDREKRRKDCRCEQRFCVVGFNFPIRAEEEEMQYTVVSFLTVWHNFWRVTHRKVTLQRWRKRASGSYGASLLCQISQDNSEGKGASELLILLENEAAFAFIVYCKGNPTARQFRFIMTQKREHLPVSLVEFFWDSQKQLVIHSRTHTASFRAWET